MDKRRLGCLLLVTSLLVPFQNCGRPFSSKLASVGTSGEGPASAPPVEPALSKDFPLVTITTQNEAPITSKDEYVGGRLVIDPNGNAGLNAFDAPMKIKGRGNSTWGMPKKPFKIKLDVKASVLGLPADKEWVLLANYSDKTLLRNYLALEMGRYLGMPYVPRARFVEVTLNGDYLGNYLLTEQVKIAPDRVNIAELKPGDIAGDSISGGYLLELDERLDEVINWRTSRGNPYTVKEPSALVADQVTWIKNHIQMIEDKLHSDIFADPVTGYASEIDIDSFIDWYLVSEVLKNQDASYSSTFLVKERGKKLAMGPLWDFDLSVGNVDYSEASDPEGWWVRKKTAWFQPLFRDPAFEARVAARWNYLKRGHLNLLARQLDKYAEMLGPSQERNFKRWPILETYVWPNKVVTGSYQGEIDYAKDFLAKRIQWMDAQFNRAPGT